MKKRLLLDAAVFVLLYGMAATPTSATEKEVSFKTEDGWTIYGMLGVPEGVRGKVPAVVFLHTFAHDSDAYGQYLYPGLAQIIGGNGVATLRIDFRGRGKSIGEKELHSFSRRELEKLYMDVRAAIAFLSAQQPVDSSRLGIVAEEGSAEAAVVGWGGDPRVKAMVLISGRLDETAKRLIASNPALPLFLVVSKEDREGFRDMASAYKLTQSEQSLISVYKDVGIGTTMFSVWRSEHPKEKPIEEGIADWMKERLSR
jgi:dienelactone hydrolase